MIKNSSIEVNRKRPQKQIQGSALRVTFYKNAEIVARSVHSSLTMNKSCHVVTIIVNASVLHESCLLNPYKKLSEHI